MWYCYCYCIPGLAVQSPGLVAQSCNSASGGLELWDGWRLLWPQPSERKYFCGRHPARGRLTEDQLQWREDWPSWTLQPEFESRPAQPDPVLNNVLKNVANPNKNDTVYFSYLKGWLEDVLRVPGIRFRQRIRRIHPDSMLTIMIIIDCGCTVDRTSRQAHEKLVFVIVVIEHFQLRNWRRGGVMK